MAVTTKSAPANAKPAELVVALTSAVGPAGRYREGAKLRANDPRVVANPAHFIAESSSSAELAAARKALFPPPAPDSDALERRERRQAWTRGALEREIEETRAKLADLERALARMR